MPVLTYRPTLVNNTDPLDFIIYTYESANPGAAIASAFWGSISQAFMFGIIAIAVSLTMTGNGGYNLTDMLYRRRLDTSGITLARTGGSTSPS